MALQSLRARVYHDGMAASEEWKQEQETESSHFNHEQKSDRTNWKWLEAFNLKARLQ